MPQSDGAWRGHLAHAAVSSRAPAALAHDFDPADGLLQPDARARRLLPSAVGDEQRCTRAIFTPPTLDRTMVMFPSTLGGGNWSGFSYDAGAGTGVHQHHEPGAGRAHGAAHGQQGRRGPLSPDDAVGPAYWTILESREPGALLHAAVRRARRR